MLSLADQCQSIRLNEKHVFEKVLVRYDVEHVRKMVSVVNLPCCPVVL